VNALRAPRGFLRWAWQGFGRTFRQPSDVLLCLRIGCFLCALPYRLERSPLPDILRQVAAGRRRAAVDPVDAGVERIARLRQAWLNLPMLAARNTCYVRAITLFRFLDGGGKLCIHIGVEPGVAPDDRLRGHAWVTHRGRLLEPPEPVLAGRVKELYVYSQHCDPPQGDAAPRVTHSHDA